MSTANEFFKNLPRCQIVSTANGRVIQARADLQCYVANSDETDSSQLWYAVAYTDIIGKAPVYVLITQVDGVYFCLREFENQEYVRMSLWDPEGTYWELGGNRAGINCIRNNSFCLTMQGADEGVDPWPVGTKIQNWGYRDLKNQNWKLRSVASK